MEIRDPDEGFGEDVAGAGFVMTVASLRAMQILCHLLLGDVLVLAQVSDSYILHKFLHLHYTNSTKIF